MTTSTLVGKRVKGSSQDGIIIGELRDFVHIEWDSTARAWWPIEEVRPFIID